MRTETTYIADDGTKFVNQVDCERYGEECREKKRMEYLTDVRDLDLKIWKKFCDPEAKDVDVNPQYALAWLKSDIEHIIIEGIADMDKIIEFIMHDKYGNRIISDVEIGSIIENVKIRKDFKNAFAKVKNGNELSTNLDYSFSKTDLSNLAKLHKSGACRRKIEELLTACNFHYECNKFINKEYAEFIMK